MKLTLDQTPPSSSLPPKRVPTGPDRERVEAWRSQIDEFYTDMQGFGTAGIDEILTSLSSFTARMSQIRTEIVRSESKLLNNFRTREIDPFIDECDRQYKIWSRQQAIRQFDYDLTRGI